jgi:phosphohistidine swiveling domain-containing protein
MNNYIFLWTNHQPLYTFENNLNAFGDNKENTWNQIENIIQVSRKNDIFTYHSKKDFEKDRKRGKNFLDRNYSKKFISDAKKVFSESWKLFNKIQKTNFSSLSDKEIYDFVINLFNNWSDVIGFYRATQAEGSLYVVKELEKKFSEKEKSILLSPLQLDIINKEQLEWEGLLQKPFSEKALLEHAFKFPWIVAFHTSFKDVLQTLNERYQNQKNNFKKSNVIQEKKELKYKQEELIEKNFEIKNVVETIHELALLRSDLKSCWQGIDFYLIPIFQEVASRHNEKTEDLFYYYLSGDIKNLLFENKKLSLEEKNNREKCFVGLWKDGKAKYYSGEEAEKVVSQELGDLAEIKVVNELKGVCANSGIAKGKVRILPTNDVKKTRFLRKYFNKGEILVTGMTQPAIMDIASKAGALVTDEGGMLSHAAIISRELKIPCVVGTEVASRVLKDGDLVEVDADKGVVRKIIN